VGYFVVLAPSRHGFGVPHVPSDLRTACRRRAARGRTACRDPWPWPARESLPERAARAVHDVKCPSEPQLTALRRAVPIWTLLRSLTVNTLQRSHVQWVAGSDWPDRTTRVRAGTPGWSPVLLWGMSL